MRNFKLYNGSMVKTRLCAVSLVGILLTGPLFGCSSNVTTAENENLLKVEIIIILYH